MKNVSVIICTYNPDPSIFSRCLSAISEASKIYQPAEIIIIDNNSTEALSNQPYIKEFLKHNTVGKIIIEEKQGLTPARLRGISEAKEELLIFIDDDNLITRDFFIKGIEIAERNPNIGAWSGQVFLEFEKEPEVWTRKYWGLLVHRELETDYWSNLPHLPTTMPCGAGLFIRKKVADYYYHLHKTGKRTIQLDRTGSSLFSGGDNDMAACACDIGLGVGLFREIKLTHFIPSFRLKKKYLLKLAESIVASSIVLKYYRGIVTAPPSMKKRGANMMRMVIKKGVDRAFFKAVLKGEKVGISMIKNLI
jgi:glycosyltransferase involved in cell wall biosynthesis